MAALTIKLPDELVQQVEDRGISQQRLEEVVTRVVQELLRELGEESLKAESSVTVTKSAWGDGEAFARRMIANNRELFEELAHL